MAESSSAQEFEFRYCKIYPNDGRDPVVVSLDLIQYFVYSENVTSPLLNEINMRLLKKPARPSYLLHLQKYKGKHSTWDPYLYLKKGECFE